jgi:hypothetical protein
LRASPSLALLRHGQGKQVESRDLLSPTYEWFTEGFDAPNLAKRLTVRSSPLPGFAL